MRRFSRGRATTDDDAPPPATGTSEAAGDAAADAPQPGAEPVPAGEDTATTNGPVTDATVVNEPTGEAATAGETATTGDATAAEPAAGRDLPAGVDLDELAAAPPESAKRGRLRRRLRYLRTVRELLLRDLGGFYAEAHRSERGPDAHRRLLDVKARRLATLDAEVRDLEARLSEPHAETVIREPGVGGTCPECGELHASDARFCSRCGAPLRGRAARERAKARAESAAGTTGTGTGSGSPAAATGTDEGDRMTTASLWGRRRTVAPAEPPEATRAGDLTQAVDRSEEATEAAPREDAPRDPESHGPESPEPESHGPESTEPEPHDPAAGDAPTTEGDAAAEGADDARRPGEEPRP